MARCTLGNNGPTISCQQWPDNPLSSMVQQTLSNNAQPTLDNNGSTNYFRKWPDELLDAKSQQTDNKNGLKIGPNKSKLLNKLIYIL